MISISLRRGEVWLVNFNPGRGSEQKGHRPALIIQNDTGNIYAAKTIVAAITSTIKEFPLTVVLSPGEGGLKQRWMVNIAQLLTIDKRVCKNVWVDLARPACVKWKQRFQ